MKHIYWVGPRQSDIEDIEFLFDGSVTIYGNNKQGNIAYCKTNTERINHNIDNENCNRFIAQTLDEICKKDSNAQFLFYNFMYAYEFDSIIRQRVLGLNSYELIEKLSDKIRCRFTLESIVETVPFITIKGKDCTPTTFSKYFPHDSDYIIQKIHSSGGEGTYHITKQIGLPSNLAIEDNADYLISPYISDAISLNTHIAIFEEQVVIFPSSIQIITEINNQLLYQGADFICYHFLPELAKERILEASNKIGEFLCKKGYRGILGIDYLLKGENLYFMEVNPRFQASSELINRALYPAQHNSLQEIHLQAFGVLPIKQIQSLDVPFSNFVHMSSNIAAPRLRKIQTSPEIINLQLDGYNISDDFPIEENIYLCRSVFDKNICSINNDKIILHPNLFVEDIKKYLYSTIPHYKAYCKIALLNHGVSLSADALALAKSYGEIREAVFDAIDITIFEKLPVNIPINCKFSSISPFTIDVVNNDFVLLCDNDVISTVKISFTPSTLLNKYTCTGIPYDAIINLANDRIRINPAPICIYKKERLACKFCNLPEQNCIYCFDDIIEVIDYCLENVDFRHFLIGGGTYSLLGGWEIILKISRYIRSKCDKDIYLMSIPPQSTCTLEQLKAAGITEVAFNLEIFNRNMATCIMPGKGTIPLLQYMSAFKRSVELWGNNGCVRSLLIYGFDTEEDFLAGVEQLCKTGVEPIVSIFRPLENTDLAFLNPPATLDIFSIYHKCQNIVKKYSLILGPDCPQCQNNTLSYPNNV